MRDSKVGVDHVLAGPHFGRRAVGNLAAVIEDDDAVGKVQARAVPSCRFTSRCRALMVCKIGSPGRIRTSDQPVNSRLLYH